MSDLPKVVFMGSDAIGIPVLESLSQDKRIKLVAVISQPDRPVGRGRKLTPNPLAAYALEHRMPLLQPEKPDEGTHGWLCDEGIDLVVVMAYGHLLKKTLLEIPPQGFVNLHASILPEYRGASPIQSAIAQGESQAGVTLMRIEPAMDAGAVCDIERVDIETEDTSESVFDKLAQASVPLIARNLDALLDGSARFAPQDHSLATYTRKLSKDDGWLDFHASARVLKCRMQALEPWPSAFCEHKGARLKMSGSLVDATSCDKLAGTVLGVGDGYLRIATGEGVLCIERMQRPGGKMLPVTEFLRGYVLATGEVLESGKMLPLLK